MNDKIRKMVYRKYIELRSIVISLEICLLSYLSPESNIGLAYNRTQKIINNENVKWYNHCGKQFDDSSSKS